MALEIYKKNQGVYARVSLGAGLGILALMAAHSLYGSLIELPELYPGARVPLVDVPFTWGLLSSLVFFTLSAFLVAATTIGLETGVKTLDNTSKKTVEFLIETQGELQKVSWPTREELTGSTVVVIVSVIILGIYIFAVDWVITRVMKLIGFI
ncbi:MAG TPA: preprotein translocase subunit SecE [Candidatus Hypogeohydataceae bacterium YC41]